MGITGKNLKLEHIIYLLIIMTILCTDRFFCILPIEENLFQMAGVLCTILAFSMIIVYKGIIRNSWFIILYNIILISFLIVQFISTSYRYSSQSIVAFIQASQQYIWILLSYPIFYYFCKDKDIEKLMDTMLIIVTVTYVLCLLSALVYNMTGSEPLAFSYYQVNHVIGKRSGRMRLIDLSCVEGLTLVWGFNQIINKEHKLKYIIMWALMFTTIVYVEQTRMVQLTMLMVCGVMFFCKPSKTRYGQFIKIVMLFILVLVVMFGSGEIMEKLAESFSTEGENGGSTTVRLDEIEYATELFLANPWNGSGLMINDVRDGYITYKGRGKFGYTDIGFYGLLAQVGMWAVLIYIVPLVRMGIITFRLKKENPYRELCIGLFVFILATSLTLLILNRTRAFMFPFCVGIFEYANVVEKERVWREKRASQLVEMQY